MTLFKLIISLDGIIQEIFELEKNKYLIGRGEANDIKLDDKKVSRSHAELVLENAGVKVEDLGSVNGIYFEGRLTKVCHIKPGGTFEVRPFSLRLETVDALSDEETYLLAQHEQSSPYQITVYLPGAATLKIDIPPGKSTLGRSADSDIIIDDLSVSRRHAEILNSSGAVRILDLGSTSGTYVDGEKITSAHWHPGKVVNLGQVRLELTSKPVDEPPPEESGYEKQDELRNGQVIEVAPKKKSTLTTKLIVTLVMVAILAAGSCYIWMRSGPPKPALNESNLQAMLTEPAAPGAANIQDGKYLTAIEQARKKAEEQAKARLVVLRLQEARSALQEDQWQKAKLAAKLALDVSPNNHEAKEVLAAADRIKREQEQIAQNKEDERRKKESQYQEYLGQYRKAYSAGSYEEAAELSKKMLTIYPGQQSALKMLHESQMAGAKQKAKKEQAAQHIERIKKYAKSYYEEGLKQVKQENYVMAANVWTKLINLDASQITPYPQKVRPMLAQVKVKLNGMAAKKVAQGRALEKDGEVVQAALSYRDALQLAPWNEDAKGSLARVDELLQKKVSELYTEGRALASLGDIREAVAKWEQALSLVGPKSQMAKNLQKQIRQYTKDN